MQPLTKYKIQPNGFVVVMVSKARPPPKPATEEEEVRVFNVRVHVGIFCGHLRLISTAFCTSHMVHVETRLVYFDKLSS